MTDEPKDLIVLLRNILLEKINYGLSFNIKNTDIEKSLATIKNLLSSIDFVQHSPIKIIEDLRHQLMNGLHNLLNNIEDNSSYKEIAEILREMEKSFCIYEKRILLRETKPPSPALFIPSNLIEKFSKAAITQSSEPPKKKKKVLIADDEPGNQKIVQRFLGSDYDLKVAMDGQEAIDISAEFNPDIILMDLRMPNKNGLEAAKEIRTREKKQQQSRVRIIAVTATPCPEIFDDMDDCLVKPFKKEDLISKIEAPLHHAFRK